MNTITCKRFLLVSSVSLACAAALPAAAFTVTSEASGVLSTVTPGAVTFATFDGQTPFDSTYATYTGGVLNVGANPGAGGNWLFANENNPGVGKVTINFVNPQTYFGLFWAANDGPFNEVRLFSGGQPLGTVFGTTGAANLFWNITAGANQSFDKIELGGVLFEVDNLAVMAVPEPGTWALFGVGLAGLSLWARRRRAQAPQLSDAGLLPITESR